MGVPLQQPAIARYGQRSAAQRDDAFRLALQRFAHGFAFVAAERRLAFIGKDFRYGAVRAHDELVGIHKTVV